MDIKTFNTGCLYTKHGQRIAWCRSASGGIAFHDRDRMITGHINPPVPGVVTNAWVHREYLHNRYQNWAVSRGIEQALMAACDAMVEGKNG